MTVRGNDQRPSQFLTVHQYLFPLGHTFHLLFDCICFRWQTLVLIIVRRIPPGSLVLRNLSLHRVVIGRKQERSHARASLAEPGAAGSCCRRPAINATTAPDAERCIRGCNLGERRCSARLCFAFFVQRFSPCGSDDTIYFRRHICAKALRQEVVSVAGGSRQQGSR